MKKKNRKHAFKRAFLRLLSVLFLLTIATAAYLGTSGFPGWLNSRLMQRASSGDFAFEVSEMKLDLSGGLVCRKPRVYRKQMLGPAFFSAERVDIKVNPFFFLSRKDFLREVRIVDGIVISRLVGERGEKPEDHDKSMNFTLMLENCVVDDLPLKNYRSRVSVRGKAIKVDDIAAVFRRGTLEGRARGSVRIDSKEKMLAGDLEFNLNPHLLVPFLKTRKKDTYDSLVELIERFKFPETSTPRAEVKFKMFEDNGYETFDLDGKVWLAECRYRGEDVLRADGLVKVLDDGKKDIVRVDPLLVVREEGKVSGGLTLDFNEKTITFNAVSSMNPRPLFKMVDVYSHDMMHNWVFDGDVNMKVNGTVGMIDSSKRNISASIRGDNMGIGGFVASRSKFGLTLKNSHVHFSDIEATLFKGTFKGDAELQVPGSGSPVSNLHYRVSCEIKDADPAKVLAAITEPKDLPETIDGTFYCRLSLTGLIGEGLTRKTAEGSGQVEISDGRVFSLPLFGGLSSMMNKLIPGLEFVLSQNNAKADFSVDEGKADVQRLKVEGDVLSMKGKGTYHLDRKLDFDVQIKLLKEHTFGGKIARIITYPLSKLFEFKLCDTLDKPRWYPVNFSSDVLEKMGFKKPEGAPESGEKKGGAEPVEEVKEE